MALWEKHAYTTKAAFFADLEAFGTANGWVSSSTGTSATLIKGGITANFADNSVGFSCTLTYGGLTSKTAYGLLNTYGLGSNYVFVSCGNNLFVGTSTYDDGTQTNFWGYRWLGVMNVVDKIGNWNGGPLLSGGWYPSTTNYQYNNYFMGHNNAMNTYGALFYEGAWTTTGAGSIWANGGETIFLSTPNYFNYAVVPIPFILCLYNTDITLLHPIGYAPDVFRGYGGDCFNNEELTIGADTYLIWDEHTYDILFKLS